MNESNETPVLPSISPTKDAAPKPIRSFEAYVRQHPANALIAVAGFGLVVVVIARALTPDPPQSRALQLLEDIQHRLTSAYGHAAHLADEGSHAVGKGVDALHLDRRLSKLSRGFQSLFH